MTAPLDSAGSLFALGFRVALLAPSGAPLVGMNGYKSTALSTITTGLEYTEGEEVTVTNGQGQTCVYYKAPDTVKRGTISDFSVCTPDPNILKFLQGGDTFERAAVQEVQTVTISGGPTGGTFTLTYAGQTTAAIAYNATSSAVQSALEALSNVEPGDVTVSGSAGGPYVVSFATALGNVSQMSASGASLTGGTSPSVAVATTTAGAAAATIGYRAPLIGSTPNADGVSVEFWTHAIANGSPADELPYLHWTLPRSFLKPSAGLAASGTEGMTPSFEGYCTENRLWGDGPVGDWLFPSDRVWQYVRVPALPDLTPGYFQVTA